MQHLRIAAAASKLLEPAVSDNLLSQNYLKPDEAANFLCRSARTLARMRAEGRGPAFHREGGVVLYRTRDLTNWLERHLVIPPRSDA